MLQLRSPVVTTDEHVAISPLPLAIQTEIIKFNNLKQELAYTTSIKSVGFPITYNDQSSLTIGEFTMEAEAIDVDQDSDIAMEAYLSTFKEYKLPLAKCELQLDSLKLNKDAIQELKQTQHLVSAQGIFSPGVQIECYDFFRKYGTHISVGAMIIGGIYWQKCYSSGFLASESGSTSELQHSVITSKTLSTFTNLKCKLDRSKVDFILNFENGEFPLESYLENATIGGSSEPNTPIADWGEQLVRNPDTWSIIDREQVTFIPIWEILHREVELGDSSQLKIALSESSNVFMMSADSLNTFFDFFERLDMKLHYPQCLTQIDSLMIREDTLNKPFCDSLKQLPWLVLQKIMSFDAKSVSDLMHTDDFEEFEPEEESNAETELNSMNVHPIDVILTLFHCSNDALRQDLFVRLLTCQLAIPLIFKDPIINKLIFPLWSLKSIAKTWRTKTGINSIVDNDEYIVDYKMPIVSFIRIGCHTISKSKLLNDIISNTHHDHFFHRDCNGGSNMRFLANGLIDLCWYLPGGKEDILFPDAVAFLNLHGDAAEEEFQTQVNFLTKISSMTFILIPEQLEEKGISIVKMFPHRVLVLSSNVPSTYKQIESQGQGVIALKKFNADVTRRRLREQVTKKCFSETSDILVRREITAFVEAATIDGIIVDENHKMLSEVRKLAMDWINDFGDLSTFKAKALPLQGESMWHKWAENDKEEHRLSNKGAENMEKYTEKIRGEKLAIRKEMIKYIQNINPSMESFIEHFLNMDKSYFTYYIKYMKINLNKKSKKCLSLLHEQYQTAKDEVTKAKSNKQENEKEKKIKDLTSKLDRLNKEIINISFGIEHLLREVAQIYESAPEQNVNLPIAAARLLIDGYPLEVMDGDASHVPISWLTEVLKNVVDLLHDPYIYVLSVLGLQSTGKSTLLNSVFGLQFNASAGRCTRGAYMQLVPISEEIRRTNQYNDKLQNEIRVNCDYILVVDTEGLRAPELDFKQTQKHDNELATFVIGLANKTIVNIYGEVAGDLDDILQTAVHAFIRMSQVNIKPSCMFVHQNAGTNAKAVVGQDRFVQKLDEMTKLAAAEEKHCKRYKFFSDVIEFDSKRDIHHFQCLWMGDPPMAPVNLGYSNSAQRLKANLIAQMRTTNCLRLSSFAQKLKDLWNALLHENFVFSFRNCLEINAYNSLEGQYTQWEWRLLSVIKQWTGKIENEVDALFADVENAVDNATVIIFTTKAQEELNTIFQETLSHILKEFDDYFENNKQKELIISWNANFKLRLQDAAQSMKQRAIFSCKLLCEGKKDFGVVVKNEVKYKQLMFNGIKEIATRLRDDEAKSTLNHRELDSEFEKSWEQIIGSLPNVKPVQIRDQVKIDVVENLMNYVGRALEQTASKAIKNFNGNTSMQLDIKQLVHVTRTPETWSETFGKLIRQTVRLHEHNIATANRITKSVLESASEFLTSIRKNMYTRELTTDMLQVMDIALSKQIDSNQELVFTNVYRIDLFVIACNYATKQFEKMVDELNRKHNPKVYLEEKLKDAFRTMFFHEYKNVEHEFKITSTLASQLCKCIERAVIKSLKDEIEFNAKVGLPFFQTKKVLKAKILLDLGEAIQQNSKEFEAYEIYLQNSKQSFQSWTTKYLKQLCDNPDNPADNSDKKEADISDSNSTKIQTWAVKAVKQDIKLVVLKIDEVMDKFQVPENSLKSSKDWLNEFRKDKDVVRRFGDVFLTSVTDLFDVHDINIESFTETLNEELDKQTIVLINDFKKITYQQLDHSVSEEFLKRVLGCCHECPFCHEICDQTNPDHPANAELEDGRKHQVENHRPDCLAGYRDSATEVMCISMCTKLVGGKDAHTCFRNKDTDQKIHKYEAYREIYPDWNIPVRNDEVASIYWKWFVGRYMKQVASMFSAKPCDVPDSWTKIEWKTVKERMKEIIDGTLTQ